MNPVLRRACAVLLLAVVSAPVALAENVHHYVFVGMDREKLAEPGFLAHKGVEGVQVKYTWRQLEQGKDHYVFDDLRTDLRLVKAKGKKLFVQVQDATFGLEFMPVPKYLREDPAYRGGVAQQASYPDGKPEEAKPYGWVARRWDPAVRERFHLLLAALGREFDGEIEGINLPESAIDIPYAGPLMPSGYTREGYRDALLETMAALKKAFPRSTALLYANFMSETDPSGKPAYLRSLYEKSGRTEAGHGRPRPVAPSEVAVAQQLSADPGVLRPDSHGYRGPGRQSRRPQSHHGQESDGSRARHVRHG